jgi:hypothetical protein
MLEANANPDGHPVGRHASGLALAASGRPSERAVDECERASDADIARHGEPLSTSKWETVFCSFIQGAWPNIERAR